MVLGLVSNCACRFNSTWNWQMVERVVSDFGIDLCAGVVTGTLRFLLRPIVIVFKWFRCLRVVFCEWQYAIA